jgi:hypothetical protein
MLLLKILGLRTAGNVGGGNSQSITDFAPPTDTEFRCSSVNRIPWNGLQSLNLQHGSNRVAPAFSCNRSFFSAPLREIFSGSIRRSMDFLDWEELTAQGAAHAIDSYMNWRVADSASIFHSPASAGRFRYIVSLPRPRVSGLLRIRS